MTNPSCIRTTYRLQITIQCHCSAYKFPHAVGKNLCSQRIESPPEFHKPKKGLASKLDHLISEFENICDSDVDHYLSLAKKLADFKNHLSGN